MARATELRRVVTDRLYPFAESRGFVRARMRHSLYTTFSRVDRDALHVFEVQWAKYGAASFVLNFGECPATGVDMVDIGHVDRADVRPGYCSLNGRLQTTRGPLGWFRLRRPFLEAVLSFERWYLAEQVVQRAIDWFPEIEDWWADKRVGPHLYIWRTDPSIPRSPTLADTT